MNNEKSSRAAILREIERADSTVKFWQRIETQRRINLQNYRPINGIIAYIAQAEAHKIEAQEQLIYWLKMLNDQSKENE